MRSALVLMTLLTFGCAELRPSTRTEMVEVAPSQSLAPPPAPPMSPSRLRRRATRGLIAGGTIAILVGGALVIGGAVGWQRQAAANARADAECEAKGGWFCNVFDDLSYIPLGVLIGWGTGTMLTGMVLVGVGAHRHSRDRTRPDQ